MGFLFSPALTERCKILSLRYRFARWGYEWSQAYEPALGHGRASASCRGFKISDQWMDYDDLSETVDRQLRAATGEAVDPLIQKLSLNHRIAVMTAVRNFVAGALIHRNPRSPDTQDADYAEAKLLLRPGLIARNLIATGGYAPKQ